MLSGKMKKVWKAVYVFLFAVFSLTFIVVFSMFYWPSIPSHPEPAEGRVYPLNNHGKHTYMNRREYLMQEDAQLVLPLTLASFGAIYYFIDPFDQKKRRYRRPPRDFKP
jgi:hypothetical protein